MKLSTKGRYGLKAMTDLAIYGNEGYISLKQIAKRQSLSENYLEQLFAVLKKNGFVKSSRGAQGGYALNLPASEISVGDILRALEGSLAPVDCVLVNENKECEDEGYCVTKFVWKRISDSINDVVNNISLESLVQDFYALKEMEKSE